jgi:hypothetical protein
MVRQARSAAAIGAEIDAAEVGALPETEIPKPPPGTRLALALGLTTTHRSILALTIPRHAIQRRKCPANLKTIADRSAIRVLRMKLCEQPV